jgi:Fe-S-cluster containining protein
MEKHFHCTACGKCCYGQLPLTIKDAFANVGRFPLAMLWTPLKQGAKDYSMVSDLGITIKLPDRKELAVLIVPSLYIPSSFPCPALGDDNLCSIHAIKPSRCKTMPFYPYREEQYQAELLTPRKEWACDVSTAAPVVFEGKNIVAREDFDQERQELLLQVPVIRTYANYMLKYYPLLVNSLAKATFQKVGGQVVTSLSSFLTATRNSNAQDIARQQLPLLIEYMNKTTQKTEFAEFHKNYASWVKEMDFLSKIKNEHSC